MDQSGNFERAQRPAGTGPTAKDIELAWYRTTYQGDSMPQLTLRAVLTGAALGMFMSLSNLYIGLKTGWALGVAITACILSFSLWRTFMLFLPRVFKTPLVPLVPLLGIAMCLYLMLGLPWVTWARFAGWLAIGLVVYFAYGFWHSRLKQGR